MIMDADTAQAATQLTGFDLAVITVVVLSTLIIQYHQILLQSMFFPFQIFLVSFKKGKL